MTYPCTRCRKSADCAQHYKDCHDWKRWFTERWRAIQSAVGVKANLVMQDPCLRCYSKVVCAAHGGTCGEKERFRA